MIDAAAILAARQASEAPEAGLASQELDAGGQGVNTSAAQPAQPVTKHPLIGKRQAYPLGRG
jgi:hypothetical protein